VAIAKGLDIDPLRTKEYLNGKIIENNEMAGIKLSNAELALAD
jgi:hypothetical protein